MWPMLSGIIAGVAAYCIFRAVRDRHAVLTDRQPTADPRVPGLIDMLYVACGAFLLLALVFAWYALTAVPAAWESHRASFWVLFRYTSISSFLLGFGVGVMAASWYRDALGSESSNLAARGIAVFGLAIVVFLFALDGEYKLFGRLTKLSTSVVSIEFDKRGVGRGDGVELNANTPTTSPIWAANEKIGFALVILKDLGEEALNIDVEALRHFQSRPPGELVEANRGMLATFLLPIVKLREDIHALKRDTNPIYFDTERLEQFKLALALRDLLHRDLNEALDDAKERDAAIARVADAYGAYVVSTWHTACLFKIGSDLPCAALVDRANWQKLAADEASRFVGKCEQVAADPKQARCEPAIPSRQVVRQSPYLVIATASMFFAAGEREAAVAMLDYWQRLALKSKEEDYDIARRLFAIRIFNLMGYMLGELASPIQLELAARYQWRALKESSALVEKSQTLKAYRARQRFPEPDKFDMLSAAARPSSDRRNECAGREDIGERGARYVVHRRVTLLNNVVYFLSLQPDVLEEPTARDGFGKLIEELRSIRADCLAFFVSRPNADWESTRATALGGILDTLARAMRVQATFQRPDDKSARSLLCDAYRAALYAERLLGEGTLLTPAKFDESSLEDNGQALRNLADVRSTRNLRRELKQAVEAEGENSCGVN